TTLSFVLEDEMQTVRENLGSSGRTGRTLVKDGPLRVTLVGLGAGGAMVPHKADGPITVQVLEGAVTFEADGGVWKLEAGSIIALRAGITHSLSSESGGIFLLTVLAMPEAAPDADAAARSA